MKYTKIIVSIALILILVLTKYILFDYPISTGKRIGNLTKLSLKGNILKTWEGTLNEGYGEKMTTFVSIKNSKLAEELYAFEGRKVILYYEENIVGWPRDTKYNIIRWEQLHEDNELSPMEGSKGLSVNQIMAKELSKIQFCALIGTLKTNETLYQEVKKYVEKNNYYLFKQYEKCNE